MDDLVMMRFKMVLKKDDVARIEKTGEKELTVDLHGLGTKDSLVLLNNIINLNRDSCNLCVIHGFNHGTALREMINERFRNPRIKDRTILKDNPGMTILSCEAAIK